MIVSRLGFSADVIQRADTIGLGEIDFLGPEQLRNWIGKQAEPQDVVSRCETIVRHAMRELAKTLAQHPDELSKVEWRDLERLLCEVFEGIGFDTRVTRSSKDGGVDLELTTFEEGKKQVYLVEVKHWNEQKARNLSLKEAGPGNRRPKGDRGPAALKLRVHKAGLQRDYGVYDSRSLRRKRQDCLIVPHLLPLEQCALA